MASLGRARRGHLSSKIANVKLRPAPAQAGEISSRRKSRFEAEEYDVNMMDREHVRRLNDEDTLEDHHDPELSHAKTALPFENQVLSYTGLTWERAALTEKLRAMGVKAVHLDLTVDATALISRGHESLKYERSVEFRIPIFRPEWIDYAHEIWLSGLEVPPIHSMVRYKLEAFAGLTIAVSGIEPAEIRQSMIQKIGDLGGKYSPSLNRECTHLIVSNPKPNAQNPLLSAKVTWAFQVNAQAADEREHLRQQTDMWMRRGSVGPDPGAVQVGMESRVRGIKVVWEGWFWDCLHFDGRFKEDAWNAEEHGEPPGFKFSYTYRENARKGRQEEEAKRAREVMQAAMEAQEGPPDSYEKPPGELDMLDMEELQAKPEELEPALIRKRPRESQSATSARRSKNPGGPGGLVDDLIASINNGPKDDRPAERDSEVVVKTDRSDNQEPKSGPRSPSPETARKRIRTAKAHSTETAPAWAPRPAASEVHRSRSSMINSSRDRAFAEDQPGPSKPAVFPAPAKETGLAMEPSSDAAAASAVTSVKGKETSMPPSRQMSTNSSTYDATVFDGLTFTHNIEGPVELFEDAVKGLGGVLIPYAQWQAGENADYIVCRLVNSQPPEKDHASNSQVVTECWVERCLKERRVCSPDDSVVFRPLTKPMPIQGIGGQAIHVSGFDEENLYYLKRLVKALGAQFAPGFSKSKTTALVSGRKYGLKVNKAVEWNLPIVSEDWLYSMARSGQLEPLSGYTITPEPEPEPEVGGEALKRTASVPVPAQVGQKNGVNRLMKPRLEATGTMNLSTVSDAGSMFGLGSSDSPGPRHSTAKSNAVSRQLGLAPTEMDLGPIPVRQDRSTDRQAIDRPRSTSASTSTSATTPIRTDAVPLDLQPGSVSREPNNVIGDMGPQRSASRSGLSETTSEPEGLAKAGRGSGATEPSRAQAYNPRRNRNGRARSALSNRTTNPFLEAMNAADRFTDHPGAEMDLEDPSGMADESMRVMYVDPKAEMERKKLVDAFQERTPPGGKKGRSRAM